MRSAWVLFTITSSIPVFTLITVRERERDRKCCSHQSQAAWTFFPPVETRAFKLRRNREMERRREGRSKQS